MIKIIAIIFVSLFSVYISVLLSQVILEVLNYKRDIKGVFLVSSASLALDYTAPMKVGIPVRIYLYKRIMNIPISVGTATVTLQTILVLFISVIISIIAIEDLFRNYNIRFFLNVLVLIILMFLIFIFANPKRFENFFSRLPLWSKTKRIIEFGMGFQDSMKKINMEKIIVLIVLMIFSYLVSTFRLYLILSLFGFNASIIHLLYTQCISFTLGVLSMMPGGIGVRDTSITLLLLYLNIPLNVAVSVTIIERLLTTGLYLVLGILSMNILGIRKLRKIL